MCPRNPARKRRAGSWAPAVLGEKPRSRSQQLPRNSAQEAQRYMSRQGPQLETCKRALGGLKTPQDQPSMELQAHCSPTDTEQRLRTVREEASPRVLWFSKLAPWGHGRRDHKAGGGHRSSVPCSSGVRKSERMASASPED